jgi:hypothetical protein
MKHLPMLLGALCFAGTAAMLVPQSVSAAPAGVTAQQQTTQTNNVTQVRRWHETGPSRFHRKWRSHHRWGSRY